VTLADQGGETACVLTNPGEGPRDGLCRFRSLPELTAEHANNICRSLGTCWRFGAPGSLLVSKRPGVPLTSDCDGRDYPPINLCDRAMSLMRGGSPPASRAAVPFRPRPQPGNSHPYQSRPAATRGRPLCIWIGDGDRGNARSAYRRYTNHDWANYLSADRLAKIRDVYEDRRRNNAEVDLLRRSNLDDRLTVVGKVPDLRNALGFTSAKQFDERTTVVKEMRNILAHGNTLLSAAPAPTIALAALDEIRGLAVRFWELSSLFARLGNCYPSWCSQIRTTA
jgi:hypothetical protein